MTKRTPGSAVELERQAVTPSRFFATAAKGTEGAVRDELRELRFRGVRATRGGVAFEGGEVEGHRACLELRTAVRVLQELATFEASSPEQLYAGVRAIEWERPMDARTTLAVRASCRSSAMTHSQFVAQKTKDAVVDRLRERLGGRPDVDLADPDVGISVHLARDVATVYLDLGGRPLHMRGYRKEQGTAPLKETLAACLVRLSGWDRRVPFCDPMCGSGTIPIEAALWAARIAPGLGGPPFGFTRWRSFDDTARRVWGELCEAARAARVPERDRPLVMARDAEPAAVAATRHNAERAGVRLSIERQSIDRLRLAEPATVVVNPPYGERLAYASDELRSMGRALASLAGSRVAVLAGSPEILRAIPKRPQKILAIMNGDLACRFALYGAPAGAAAANGARLRA